MMKTLACVLFFLASFLLSVAGAAAQNSSSVTSAESKLPYTPSLDVTSMDRSVDPCENLYQYACGSWQKNNPIPPDQTSWSVYVKLYQDNLTFLRGMLEQAAQPAGQRDAVTQKIGDFYAACMDEAAAEKRGLAAIQPQLSAITQLSSIRDLAPLAARLTLPFGDSILFAAGSTQDPDNSELQIADLDQGGLGLPDRDYYTKQDAKSKEIRQRYVQHVEKVFELLGDGPEAAQKNAATVMRIETALATASLTQVDRRDPYKLKHKMKVGLSLIHI